MHWQLCVGLHEESDGLMDQPVGVRLAQWPHQLWRIPKSRCAGRPHLVCHLVTRTDIILITALHGCSAVHTLERETRREE